MEKRIALVTCSKYPELTKSDQVLAATLRSAGAVVTAVDWRHENVHWERVDVAVVRSTWDYHLYAEEFDGWVTKVESLTRLINSPSLLRWNANKRYLAELRERRVPMLTFVLVEPAAPLPIPVLDGWSGDVVLKPLVGASAWQIARVPASDVAQAITEELQRTGYLIQPYAPEVVAGEYSIMFFAGEFSHAVLKKPATGDFRTQTELGGNAALVQPPEFVVTQAAAVLGALREVPTYARIDGIVQHGRFLLMEAELIEPELFFHLFPQGAETFAHCILKLA